MKSKTIAKKYCKKYQKVYPQKEWHDGYKESVMKRALIYKFSQHKDLLKLLIETGNAKLVEDSYTDSYWGGSILGSQNRLGSLLMELRDNYNETSTVFISGSKLDPIQLEN